MSESNTMESMRAWLRTCPAIIQTLRFGVDYLRENAGEYALYAAPSTIAMRENVLGEEVPQQTQQLNFTFASREPFGADSQRNAQNLAFFTAVTEWILQQNAEKNFPEITEGRVRSIVPTLTGYAADASDDTATYQIQIRLIYRRTT